MSQVQVGAKPLQSLIGEKEVLLWDSVSGPSKAIEGLSIERAEGSRNESVLLFRLDATIWAPPRYDREVRVAVDRTGLKAQYPFVRKNRTEHEEGFFFMQIRICLGAAPVKVLAKKVEDPEMAKRDASRAKSRALNLRRQRVS
ncbi:MAG: hypothetical protein E6P95_01675 [Candidatus Moraniibacteriota bacterium]|nr:MAG: hypothetical protein E6P95_01675 [Candidatus Moranbacteria bacterium]